VKVTTVIFDHRTRDEEVPEFLSCGHNAHWKIWHSLAQGKPCLFCRAETAERHVRALKVGLENIIAESSSTKMLDLARETLASVTEKLVGDPVADERSRCIKAACDRCAKDRPIVRDARGWPAHRDVPGGYLQACGAAGIHGRGEPDMKGED
jgi:hypothetical protein